jgi:AcrR family transcriptional regulator
MVRQARSEATRKKIINAAVDLFGEMGYSATGLGDITERMEMTKGALYYHFDSKESLATAIVEEGATALLEAFLGACRPSSPALENMVHGLFVVSDLFANDKVARTGVQLLRTFAEFTEASSRTFHGWLQAMATQARQAQAEGDLRDDLDPAVVSDVIVGAMLGTELISHATSGGADLIQRVLRTWEILLPAIATDESLPYFREYLARESLRQPQRTLSIE